MIRRRLKCGGKPRKKAMLGADGAVMAAATLAAAGMTTAATLSSAKSQAKAVEDSAKIQAKSIKDQTVNNELLQKQQLSFTRQQNQENRQQQQDIQTTLQLMAGQENMNDRLDKNKMQVKLGGRPKRRSISQPFYRGGQFRVTDGGGVIPLSVTPDGSGLYELYGNDHEHYHKTSNGKNKSGVGIKFNDGSIVEGEGNQNTNQGELLYVTPNDAMFISKHSIDGFNPAKAVLNGVHPEEAFATQEYLKSIKGLKDDGSKRKNKSIKRTLGGFSPAIVQANMTQNPSNGTAPVVGGVIYGLQTPIEELQYKNSVAKCGGHRKLKCGGRHKALFGYRPLYNESYIANPNNIPNTIAPSAVKVTPTSYNTNSNTTSKSTVTNTSGKSSGNFWNNHAGAVYNATGNLLGAGISTIGNMIAARRLGKAYSRAGSILADAYSQMHGIDMSELKAEDYTAPHTMAVIRDANNLSYDPQRQRVIRNSDAERREINRGTLSSAARQQRLAATNDRMLQRISEIDATENNAKEQIRQGNAERITQTAQTNADRDVQARKDFNAARLSLLQYNNDIENAKIAGIAQAQSDAITQNATVKEQGLQTSTSAIGNALTASGQAFSTSFDNMIKNRAENAYAFAGMSSTDQQSFVLNAYNPDEAKAFYNNQLRLYNSATNSKDKQNAKNNINALAAKYPKLGFISIA